MNSISNANNSSKKPERSWIYTRTGDNGTTSLVGGVRIAKTDDRLEAYGSIDELNAAIGWIRTLLRSEEDTILLHFVQNRLFSIGSFLATDRSKTPLREGSCLSESDITRLEQRIDAIDAVLPPLHAFVLPGGTTSASATHLARAICRRAERAICRVESDSDSELVRCFINRLSDYLFILSRLENQLEGFQEFFWEKDGK